MVAGGDAPATAVAPPEEVWEFWFGPEPWAHAKMWFEAGRALDAEVRRRFLATVEAALRGELDGWAATPRDRICLIVILDQFTRHVFRDTPRFVAGDEAAQRWAVDALHRGMDAGLRSDEKMFLVLPLEHAEDVALQRRALAEAERLARLHPELREMRRYVQEHAEIVLRFGRFPDRNHVLGRPSTPEERKFLAAAHLPWFEPQPELDAG